MFVDIIRVVEQRSRGGNGGFHRDLARSHRRGRLVPCGELAVEGVSCRTRRQETEKAAEAERLRRDLLVRLGCWRQGRFERRLSEEEK